MSKIEDLIKQYCPDGCEWKRLGDLVSYEQPSKYIVKSTNYSDEYEVPVLTAGQSFVLGYTNEHDNIYNASPNNPVIIFDDFTGAFHWVDFPFKVKSSAMKMLRVGCNDTTLRYVYHVMRNIGYTSDEHKRLWISLYSNFQIPVPYIAVQDEIVRILDEYTELEAELEAKLSEEIELKQKQYEVYRDELLTFGDDVEWKLLKDVITDINTGLNPRKFFKVNTVDAENYYVTIREMVDGKIVFSERTYRINDAAMRLCNNRSKLDENTVLFSGTGTIGRTVVLKEKPTNWDIKEGVYAIHPIVSKILPDYLGYILHASYVVSKYMSLAVGGTVNSVPMRELKNIEIPVPSPTEQERIVKILDKYDTYTRDMISTLNTELESRKKQYAYYRDQLLTFKRKE